MGESTREGLYAVTRIVVSLGVLGAALTLILLDRYPDDVEKWAFGVIGVILGFWLK